MATEHNVVTLKKQRAMIKGSCTRINSYVSSITSVSPIIRAQLEERKAKLETYWLEYQNVQGRLEITDEQEADDRIAFEEAYFSVSAAIREKLYVPSPSDRAITVASPSTVSASDIADSRLHVRLPKLSLPRFTGKYDEWFPFYDAFHSIIHVNTVLNNVQKFQYLRGCLSGEANDVISSLEISDLNYEVAWNLLKERYDNKRVIVHTHVKAIMELPSMNKENACELRQIADGATKHIHALQALKRPVKHWDDLLIYVLSAKLDSITLREWQTSLLGSDIPTLKQFTDFVSHRGQVLEATGRSSISTRSASFAKRQSACHATIQYKCSFCNGEHSVYRCKGFLALSVPNRISEMRKRKVCINCLRSRKHNASECTSGNCRTCKSKHNTLVHQASDSECSNQDATASGDSVITPSSATTLVTHTSCPSRDDHVMLSTALVYINDNNESHMKCRALLDCGSQANFVTRSFLNKLGVKPRSFNVTISGVNGASTKAHQAVRLRLKSRVSSYSADIDCIVTDRVTERLPAVNLRASSFHLPRNLKLADPCFYKSSNVDLLIGAGLFWDMLCVGQVKSPDHPTLQKTRLGWILTGRSSFQGSQQSIRSFHASISNAQLHKQLNRFWEQENLEIDSDNYTSEESYCEQHFLRTVSLTPQNRYMVRLPIKNDSLHKLSDSRAIALKRLLNLEKRFDRDPVLKEQYTRFMNEYLFLEHMRKVDVPDHENVTPFYLPHHCVHKVSGNSAKLRVVFDASCKDPPNLSLNDILTVGPVVQQDLASILMRFRTFIFVFAADIVKMYRQILVDPSQLPLQRILWRNNSESSVDTYELTTVTYGTASASYLATRCLKHLAQQYEKKYPTGSIRVKRDFYVDDILTGADSFQDLQLVRDEVIELLRLGSFELGKWASNCPKLLEHVNDQRGNPVPIESNSDSRVLGIRWDQTRDIFLFTCDINDNSDVVSKRSILSSIARLFDPLGLIGPTIVVAKLILQELWQTGIQWDESVPQSLHSRWIKFRSGLPELNQIQVTRSVKFTDDPERVEIHGFCDASQSAYGACIYLRTKMNSHDFRIELLCSKSRVAPLKAMSLPRLELAAALLLAQLYQKVSDSFDTSRMRIYLWSDSTITLHWINSLSRKWPVFVANRVGQVQRLTKIENWRHVPSSDNPADLLSRGVDPQDLYRADTWWHGPAFLQLDHEHWPSSDFVRQEQDLLEEYRVVATVATFESSIIDELLVKHSSLDKICRILAYSLRLRRIYRQDIDSVFVSPSELSRALNVMCRSVQRSAFQAEYAALSKGSTIKPSSKLLVLAPFIDSDGLLRVGGRLKNSDLAFGAKHSILLPSNHEFTRRLVHREHVRNLHAGVQGTMAAVRQTFWPLSLRSVTRKIIRGCVICFKARPVRSEAIMGSLPESRVTMSRPFSQCGVDYAGPVILREGKRRNSRNRKAYISIFVCFATRAVHIELVSDLTTDSFIAAFKRFIARRGKPVCMHSDNGTTFIGAHNQLKEIYDLINSDQVRPVIKQFLCDQGISWRFIPPNTPHHGGLWEAAVKSAKHHLYRIIGRAHLTFEEMCTVLYQIEAILNSRPLMKLSEDPSDFMFLSPGHFLIGSTLNDLPCHDLRDVNENRLSRWQRVEQVKQHFWQRWSNEYLHSLQERTKWKVSKGVQLEKGQLVLIQQQGLAPLQWLLGRVQELHVGSDGVARTAIVRTAKGVLTRPLSRLAILPVDK